MSGDEERELLSVSSKQRFGSDRIWLEATRASLTTVLQEFCAEYRHLKADLHRSPQPLGVQQCPPNHSLESLPARSLRICDAPEERVGPTATYFPQSSGSGSTPRQERFAAPHEYATTDTRIPLFQRPSMSTRNPPLVVQVSEIEQVPSGLAEA